MRAKNDDKNGKDFRPGDRKLRLLVAIASFGEKNIQYLKEVISTYQGMEMDVDIVVLSEAPKSLVPGVKVMVGLPSKNPWSLPFGHQRLFAENADRYDLFIYSEDDVRITEESIRAFLRMTEVLDPNEIAGFMRYEVGPAGTMYLPDAHGGYHWKPDSVRKRGDHLFAEYTNEHTAFYLVNQAQLKRAIASGGFLCEPHEGRYDMLCTAATDIYACCGFRKVLCVSDFEKFLLHHLSNRYAGRIGLPLCLVREQIATLKEIQRGNHPATALCSSEPKLLHSKWSKDYEEKPRDAVLKKVPRNAKTILSIGCGGGETEIKLKQRGLDVTVFPLDSVIGAKAQRRGIKVIYGTLDECLECTNGRQFDSVLISNILHLFPDPARLLERCSGFVAEGGSLLVNGPNFARIGTLLKCSVGWKDYRKLRCFDESGISICGPGALKRKLADAGFYPTDVEWFNHEPIRWRKMRVHGRLGWLTASDWVLQAQRLPVQSAAGRI